jgi:hypothetical protein
VIAEPFTADPALPGLEAAGDPDSMLRHFGEHLRPAGETAYEIRDCRLSRVRYRRGQRCVLQYVLNLSHPVTGAERAQWVTGVKYTGGKTRRKWEKLLKSESKVPGTDPAFEPFAYIPELDMLVEVFPYDRRLPGLPFLMAGPSPELEAPILAHFGPGWRIEAWTVELVRYRAELGPPPGSRCGPQRRRPAAPASAASTRRSTMTTAAGVPTVCSEPCAPGPTTTQPSPWEILSPTWRVCEP